MKRTKRRRAGRTSTPFRPLEWQEARDGELGITISFEGIDLDERAELEIENFARAVKTPAKEDPGGTAMPITVTNDRGYKEVAVQGLTPLTGIRLGLGALLTFVGYEAIPDATRRTLDASHWNTPAILVVIPALLALFLLGALLPNIVSHVRTWRAQPVTRSPKHAFRLSLSPVQLVVERTGRRLALDTGQIERFEGGERLRVIRRDGTYSRLPCSLTSETQHRALAARLNELLNEYRGYRG